tara:strand:+ start:1434 stop:1829 length:396 start_codon:yes stop_codon:yes gene_type:complete
MAVLTGASGSLRFRGSTVGRCRDWSVSISRDALEDTTIGAYERTYIPGLIGATGSATILYDPTEYQVRELLNSIFENESGDKGVEFIFDKRESKSFSCKAFVTSVSQSVSVGDVQAVSVSFQITGPINGGF